MRSKPELQCYQTFFSSDKPSEVPSLIVYGSMFLSILFGLISSGSITQSTQTNPLRDNSASFDTESRTSPFGLRIDARLLTKENFQKFYDGKQPIILTNVFEIKNDLWTHELLTTLGEGVIEYDVRHSSDGYIESYEATLNEFVASLSENSDHDENMYLMNEDLLRNETKLLDFLKESESLFGEDLFQFFPDSIRPYQALIIGGVGARSFLHCDPYEWMGINYLFEGRKLCASNKHFNHISSPTLHDFIFLIKICVYNPIRDLPLS